MNKQVQQTAQIQARKVGQAVLFLVALSLVGCLPKTSVEVVTLESIDSTSLSTVEFYTDELGSNQELVIQEVGATFRESVAFKLVNGTYSILTRGGNSSFGTFTLKDNQITQVTGALLNQSTGEVARLGFDTSKLNLVTINPSVLSIPAGRQSVAFIDFGVAISSTTTFYVPNGTYTAYTREGRQTFGTFTVSGGRVTNTTGAVVGAQTDISFDTSKLNSVSVNPSNLSFPAGRQYVTLIDLGSAISTMTTYSIPNGTYAITTREGNSTYGRFTVTNGSVTRVTGVLSLSGSLITFGQ